MRPLPDVLALDPQSRLTSVQLLPLARENFGTAGSIVVNVATGTSQSSAVGGSAISSHLRNVLGVIGGVQGNGSDWFATFEHVTHPDPNVMREVSRAGVIRALDLTGVGTFALRTIGLDWSDFRDLYRESECAPVDDWSTVDLLLGTVLNLWHGDLPAVVDLLSDDGLTADAAASYRRIQIDTALFEWSATYKGPERL